MLLPEPQSHTFMSQRLALNYVAWGDPEAPVLILQHGGRDHARSWDHVAAEFYKDWYVVAPDLRGHGDSAWACDGDYALHTFVYDFAELIHQLGREHVTVIAHSMGGAIACAYNGLYPDKISKFVNIEGLGLSPQYQDTRAAKGYANLMREWIEKHRAARTRTPRRYPDFDAALKRMREENPFLSDTMLKHLTTHAVIQNEDGSLSWKFDPCVGIWSEAEPSRYEIWKLWEDITCPTLLFYGSDSFISNPEKDGRAAHLKTATFIEYQNAGHWLHHDQFDRFIADVKAFL